jgi:uncharacterized protein (DUF1778 family)
VFAARKAAIKEIGDAASRNLPPLPMPGSSSKTSSKYGRPKTTAAEMPRAALQRQLSGWVKDLLTESKIQLTLTERRELVESLIADIPGLESVPVRKERFEARISRTQKELFKRAAELQGRTLTDFVIASAQDAAVRIIGEMENIRLSPVDSRAFAEALLNPRQPPTELRAAAQRYGKMVGQ